MRSSVELKQGEIINGAYRVLSKVGEGGMGQVYRVDHLAMGRQMALKAYHREGTQAELNADWQRFQNEAKTISKLSHRSIIHVYDFGVTACGTAFYVMDYINGKTLSERIREHGQLEMRQALAIFIEVAEGLAYAHSQGLVHGDIKPSNIMLTDAVESNAAGNVKIVDFGLVKNYTEDNAAGSGDAPPEGSPPYMSPEQFQHGAVDYRSDIYSFGCALFEALTGVPPFISDSALVLSMKHCTEEPPSLTQASLGRDFPLELELIESRLLAKDPAERYLHMGVVAEDLQGVLDSLKSGSDGGFKRAPAATGRKVAAETVESQETTVAPLGAARTARMLLILAPIVVVCAGLAIAATLGWRLGIGPNTDKKPHEAPPTVSQAPTIQPPQTTTTTTTTTQASVSETGPSYDRDNPNNKNPFSETLTRPDGSRVKVFHFPSKITLGRLVDRDSNEPYGILARGDVTFGADKRLIFHPSIPCCSSPSYFRRFRPDDLTELSVNNNETITAETVNYFDHLTRLTGLALFTTSVNDEAITPINQLPALQDLDVSQTLMTGTGLAKLEHMDHIIALRAGELTEMPPLLKALKKADKVEILHLDGTQLSDDDLKVIVSLSKLRVLSLASTNLNQARLNILSGCPHVEEFIALRNGLRADSLSQFKKFKALKTLSLTCDSWSPAEIAAFKGSLPGVKLVVDDKF